MYPDILQPELPDLDFVLSQQLTSYIINKEKLKGYIEETFSVLILYLQTQEPSEYYATFLVLRV